MTIRPSDSEDLSDLADNSDNYQIVPSGDEEDTTHQGTEEEEEETPEPQPPHPLVDYTFRILKFILLPLGKLFFAPAAQKTFVKTSIFILTLSWILSTSFFAYIFFYQKHVPHITHIQPIWFNYDKITPRATIDLSSGPSFPLRHDQIYDISVQLHVPTSDVNFNIGNFMLNLELQTQDGSSLLSSSRPSILRYQSQTQRIMRVVAKAIPLLVGFAEESQVIDVRLVDGFKESKFHALSKAFISISDSRLQIYDARLLILANFKGLRYYMYFYSISTAMTFILIFACIEFVFATVAWKAFGEGMWHRLSLLLHNHEKDTVEEENDSQVGDASEKSE